MTILDFDIILLESIHQFPIKSFFEKKKNDFNCIPDEFAQGLEIAYSRASLFVSLLKYTRDEYYIYKHSGNKSTFLREELVRKLDDAGDAIESNLKMYEILYPADELNEKKKIRKKQTNLFPFKGHEEEFNELCPDLIILLHDKLSDYFKYLNYTPGSIFIHDAVIKKYKLELRPLLPKEILVMGYYHYISLYSNRLYMFLKENHANETDFISAELNILREGIETIKNTEPSEFSIKNDKVLDPVKGSMCFTGTKFFYEDTELKIKFLKSRFNEFYSRKNWEYNAEEKENPLIFDETILYGFHREFDFDGFLWQSVDIQTFKNWFRVNPIGEPVIKKDNKQYFCYAIWKITQSIPKAKRPKINEWYSALSKKATTLSKLKGQALTKPKGKVVFKSNKIEVDRRIELITRFVNG